MRASERDCGGRSGLAMTPGARHSRGSGLSAAVPDLIPSIIRAMPSVSLTDSIAARFLRFAAAEADGSSPLYAALARGVAADPFALGFLAGLPSDKRQPNLMFAALRHVCGTPSDWPRARATLRANAEPVRAVMLARRTQTNEPARCATLLPVLARLKAPLALLEVGASAGLCLLPDHYGYAYGSHQIAAASPDAPTFPARANDATPLPVACPPIAWRAGLDLAPIKLRDPEQAAWLETLVWPEHTKRLRRLRAAIRLGQAEPPPLHQGDLLSDLAAVACTVPAGATLVVFHSAVLAYVRNTTDRRRFAAAVRDLGAVWVSNEAPGVFPAIAARVTCRGRDGAFLLAVDGTPVAWTHPHGAWIDWLEPGAVSD